MDKGYSVVLGEFTDAISIDHRDCEPLQIVCPICYEPLFKVVRAATNIDKHYLSHFRGDLAYASDCELRSKRISSAISVRHNAESRGQKLAYFLRVFRDLLEKDPFINYQHDFSRTHSELPKSKAYRFFRSSYYDHTIASGYLESDLMIGAEQYIAEMTSFGQVPKTEFSLSVQKRISADLIRCLYTEQQRPNYSYLFGHACLILTSKFSNGSDSKGSVAGKTIDLARDAMAGIISGSDEMAHIALLRMRSYTVHPPFVSEPMPLLSFLGVELTHEMHGALLRLPYFDLMKLYAEKQTLADGQRLSV